MKTLIAQLNHVAEELAEGGASPLEATEETAELFRLEQVTTSDQCRIYRCADDTLINAWIDGIQGDYVGDGGYGFDDQVEWYIDDLITQAEAAELRGVTVQAIHNAIKDGRLRGYTNPVAKYQRQERVLVSKEEVEAL